MPMIKFANYPKPIRNAPVVSYPCQKCGKDTGHFMFTTDANYVGPIILMPLSKLAPKHIHIICPLCLNMVELKRGYGEKLLETPQQANPTFDAIQDAISDCYKKLSAFTGGGFMSASVRKAREEQINKIVQAYYLRVTTIMAAANESKTKKCPFCKEEIKFDAIKCRFCGSDLSNIE